MIDVLQRESLHTVKPVTALSGAAPILSIIETILFRQWNPLKCDQAIAASLAKIRALPPANDATWEPAAGKKVAEKKQLIKDRLERLVLEKKGLSREQFDSALDEVCRDRPRYALTLLVH